MALALKPLTSCTSCRQNLLRSFIASIGFPPPSPSPQRRPFSRTTRRPNEARERIQQSQPSALDRLEAASAPQPRVPVPEPERSVPWYLQPSNQPPQPTQNEAESPMAARQRIPDLPPHSPPLLAPLLKNISLEQGMDTLTLLDLRSLDPPPALGANLIMILGTARSEKHLHVSADRLCRWLRTSHDITPFADGLLGRNELKLKLRRRAKRTRLMSGGVGAGTSDTDLEEGIRTGWVCVNIGRVEGGELPEQQAERERRQASVVGFGTQETGCSIVVQLMTEEKRGEIDLERLWGGMLKGAMKEKALREGGEGEVESASQDIAGQDSAVRGELDPVGMAESVGSVQRDHAMSA
ncbi:ATPase synthesis protein 25 mitochondrial [Elasticomyces elasticus]|nr:ATPase synthesis protein 25 mitochondrial [Elasticomyces elasticus]